MFIAASCKYRIKSHKKVKFPRINKKITPRNKSL